MKVSMILKAKGGDVFTINVESSLADVVAGLVEHNCGSLVVMDNEQLCGIVTERDILKVCSGVARPMNEIPVREVMTADVVTGSIDDKISDVMGLMTERRIRHLPVVDGGKLAGIISIGDVVKAEHSHLTMENHYLKNYIQS